MNSETNLNEESHLKTVQNFVTNEDSSEQLSKRAKNRLMRKRKWEETKKTLRKKEKEKQKLKRSLQREKGEPSNRPNRKHLKNAVVNSTSRQRVAIDIGLDSYMTDRDITKTCKQIQRCYAFNRRAKSPLQLYITNCNGKTKEKLFAMDGTQHWDVNFQTCGYMEAFSKEDIVYLTSESDCVLDTLDDSKVYIIGGLVDHNKHKGLCLTQAQQNEVSHARLPIDEFIQMKTRKVLVINHVFEILLRVAHGETWKDAFMNTLAPRKGAVPKECVEITHEDHMQNTCHL